jgi:hypothetical protein
MTTTTMTTRMTDKEAGSWCLAMLPGVRRGVFPGVLIGSDLALCGQAGEVDGNQLCDLGHAPQIVLFYRCLAATAQAKQRLDIKCLTDSV